jgi:hypothetical protein
MHSQLLLVVVLDSPHHADTTAVVAMATGLCLMTYKPADALTVTITVTAAGARHQIGHCRMTCQHAVVTAAAAAARQRLLAVLLLATKLL